MGLAKLLLVVSFGFAMITFYERPIPGFGVSFSNLITDQTAHLASLLSARSIQNAQESLNTLWNALEQPDPWSILANLLYWGMLLLIGLAQFALLFVVCFGLIASAVCALVGPLFIPFFIVPTLDWLFWNWLKAFVQYPFMPVIANAFILVFERFLSRYLPDPAAGAAAGRAAPLRRPRGDDSADVHGGRLARAVAHEFHLLRPWGRGDDTHAGSSKARSLWLYSVPEPTCDAPGGRSLKCSFRSWWRSRRFVAARRLWGR